jgi:hypothetical protein
MINHVMMYHEVIWYFLIIGWVVLLELLLLSEGMKKMKIDEIMMMRDMNMNMVMMTMMHMIHAITILYHMTPHTTHTILI